MTLRLVKSCLPLGFLLLTFSALPALAENGPRDCLLGIFKEPTPSSFLSKNASLIESNSAAKKYPQLISQLETIGKDVPNLKEWGIEKPGLTAGEVIEKSFEVRIENSRLLKRMAQDLPAHEPMQKILLQAGDDFLPTRHEIEKLKEKITSGEANRMVDFSPENSRNDYGFNGYFSTLYGTQGELLVAASLNQVESRSVQIRNLYGDAAETLKRSGNSPDRIRSVLEKELDIITRGPNGIQYWVEVKAYKNPVSLQTLKTAEAKHKSIFQQAQNTLQIIKDLHLEKSVKVKQVFTNCIEKAAANALIAIGIEVLGCIQGP